MPYVSDFDDGIDWSEDIIKLGNKIWHSVMPWRREPTTAEKLVALTALDIKNNTQDWEEWNDHGGYEYGIRTKDRKVVVSGTYYKSRIGSTKLTYKQWRQIDMVYDYYIREPIRTEKARIAAEKLLVEQEEIIEYLLDKYRMAKWHEFSPKGVAKPHLLP